MGWGLGGVHCPSPMDLLQLHSMALLSCSYSCFSTSYFKATTAVVLTTPMRTYLGFIQMNSVGTTSGLAGTGRGYLQHLVTQKSHCGQSRAGLLSRANAYRVAARRSQELAKLAPGSAYSGEILLCSVRLFKSKRQI